MRLIFFILLLFLFLCFPTYALASNHHVPSEEYLKADVIKIIEQGEVINNGSRNLFQDLEIKLSDGKVVELRHGDPVTLKAEGKLKVGDSIVLVKSQNPDGKTIYSVYDKYRTNNLLIILALFAILVIGIAGVKG